MRRLNSKTLIVAAVAVALVGAAWWYIAGPQTGQVTADTNVDRDSVARAGTDSVAHERQTEASAGEPSDVARGEVPQVMDDGPGLATAERRDGESESIYQGRMLALEFYEDFATDAGMSSEQERRVLQILADAQHEWAQLEVAQSTMNDPEVIAAEVERNPITSFDEEFAVRLREVLSDEQMMAFRKHIGGAYQFASVAPMNTPLPPQLVRYGKMKN